jgi:hypothetical protein
MSRRKVVHLLKNQGRKVNRQAEEEAILSHRNGNGDDKTIDQEESSVD